LQVTQHTAQTASRRLRAAKEAMVEWRKDSNKRDEGVRYVEQGCWDQRLRMRESANVCQDVLGGFEEVCGMWRERLLSGGRGSSGEAIG
jgi:hypothetical protein